MAKENPSLVESMTFLDEKVVVTGAASGIGKQLPNGSLRVEHPCGFSTLTKRDCLRPLAA
jgi:hypothetical protein